MQFSWLDKSDYHFWNSFVENSPTGSVFSMTDYLDTVGVSYKIAVLHKGQNLQAGLVLAKGAFGQSTNPIWAKHLGPVIRPVIGNPAKQNGFMKDVSEQLAKALLAEKSFAYNFHPNAKYIMPWIWQGYRVEPRFSYRFAKVPDIEALSKLTEPRMRQAVRKAEKNGLSIDWELPSTDLFDMLKHTYDRQNTKTPYEKESFIKRTNRLRELNMFRAVGAKDKKGQIHAAVGLVYGTESSYLVFNGVNYNMPSLGGNIFLIYNLIPTVSEHSQAFDFEGSMIAPIERFYRGFGAELTCYYHVYRPSIRTKSLRLAKDIGKKVLGYDRK